MKRPRLLMADDHTLVLEGFRRILESQCDVVGTAEDGQALVNMAQRTKPDVVLIDISMPMMNGFEAARQIRKTVPAAKLIFVTMHADPAYVEEAFRVGASAYVLKRSAVTELTEAIQQAMNGRHYVTPLVTRETLARLAAPPDETERFGTGLTARERQVLQLIAEGRAGKEIAYVLHISLKTVDFHKQSIMRKLSLHSTAELTRYAVRQGLIDA